MRAMNSRGVCRGQATAAAHIPGSAAKTVFSKISPHMSACPRATLLNPFLCLSKKLYKRYNILFRIFKCRVDGLPDISRILTCITADASSRRIHHWQQHVFTTFVILRACITQISLVFIDALSTGVSSWFPALITWNYWQVVPGKNLDRLLFR